MCSLGLGAPATAAAVAFPSQPFVFDSSSPSSTTPAASAHSVEPASASAITGLENATASLSIAGGSSAQQATDAKQTSPSVKEADDDIVWSAHSGIHPDDAKATVEVKGDSTNIYKSALTFEELKLPSYLLQGAYGMNFSKPSKIQGDAIPLILSTPRRNFIGQSQSGSGKTAAYSLGLLAQIEPELKVPQGLVVVPTRELANQVFSVLQGLSKTNAHVQIYCVIPREHKGDHRADRDAVITSQVIVGTPGSLIGAMKHERLKCGDIHVLVLDEADIMINRQGLGEQSMQIKRKMTNPKLQILLFSATYPEQVSKFAEAFAPNALSIIVKRENLSIKNIQHFFFDVRDEEQRYQSLMKLYTCTKMGQMIIFVQSRKEGKLLKNRLCSDKYSVSLITGELTGAERDTVMEDFRTGRTSVLVTTNVLARGIDVLGVTLIVNYQLPMKRNGEADYESYLHRVGRSGRFERLGVALNYVFDPKTRSILASIARHYGIAITALPPDNAAELQRVLAESLQRAAVVAKMKSAVDAVAPSAAK